MPTLEPADLVIAKILAGRPKSCATSAENTWPIDGTCVFPIDLLHIPGPLALTRTRGGRLEA